MSSRELVESPLCTVFAAPSLAAALVEKIPVCFEKKQILCRKFPGFISIQGYLGGLRRVNKSSNSASPQQDLMLQAW